MPKIVIFIILLTFPIYSDKSCFLFVPAESKTTIYRDGILGSEGQNEDQFYNNDGIEVTSGYIIILNKNGNVYLSGESFMRLVYKKRKWFIKIMSSNILKEIPINKDIYIHNEKFVSEYQFKKVNTLNW